MSKKIFFFTFLSLSAFASPVGNPFLPNLLNTGLFYSEESVMDFRLGYEGGFVSDRRMHQKNGMRVDNFEYYPQSGSVTMNFKDRLDVYSILGSVQIKTDWRTSNSELAQRIVAKTDYEFYWSIGTNILLIQWGNTAFGIGGRYNHSKPSLSSLKIDGEEESGNLCFDYSDWQANLGISHRVNFLVPYIGVKYSDGNAKLQGTQNLDQDFESKDHWGLYLGCSITNGKIVLVNVEIRFIDEEAASVSVEMRF